jgi:hypothetical protein
MTAPDDPPGGKMHFTRMDQGTDADYEVLKAVHVRNMAALPDLLLGMLTKLDGDANYWMLFHHPLFQTYFYARHLGLDPKARDQFKDNPHYQLTVDFTTNWDEVSFDPAYENEPIETFEPMVRRVLNRPWRPPNPSSD